MTCTSCNLNPIENRDTGLCASCGHALRKAERQSLKDSQKKKTPPKKMSAKMKTAIDDYVPKKNSFLKGKRCAVFPDQKATQVHHMRGKGMGYFDDWARERGITKLMDERFWLAVSFDGHRKIEDNPEWAKNMGYSMDRQPQQCPICGRCDCSATFNGQCYSAA